MQISQFNQQMQALMDNFALDQRQGGCALTVFYQDKQVTALGAGMALADTPFTPTTLSLNFSTGKGILVTLIHVLVSEKLLAYDVPIAQYWQGFGQNGKETITLRQLLSHEAGLYDITSVTEHATDMLDWTAMLTKIEQMPVSDAKQASEQKGEKFIAYSALVSGWVLGGLVEKVTGLDLQLALQRYLLEPLNLVGQVYMGVPADKVNQVAKPFRTKAERAKPTLVEDSPATLDFYADSPCYPLWQQQWQPHFANQPPITHANAVAKKLLTTADINGLYFSTQAIDLLMYKASLVPAGSRGFNYYDHLQAKIPAVNTVASSQALATIYAMLANGGEWQGRTVINKATFEQLSQVQNSTQDKVMPAVMNWRLGYHRVFSCQPVEQAFGHMGYNGSVAWCDPSRQLAVAFTHNYDVTMMGEIRQFIVNETILEFFK